MKQLDVKIKYLTDITPLFKTGIGDWIDLRCARDLLLISGEYCRIPLGIAVELPEGFEAIIAPRSSSFEKFGFVVPTSFGVVDESYCGDNDEWHLPVLAMRDCAVSKDSRIAQFRIVRHQPDVNLISVESLGNPDRGGFGSTGIE